MFDTIVNSWWFKTLMYAALAAFGGTLGYIMRTVDNQEKVIWWRAALEGTGAAFVGLLFMFVCQEMKLSQGYTGVIVGVSGWLGANVSIRLLETIVRKRLGIAPEENRNDPSTGSNSSSPS